jgi:hypothetical protein
LAGFRRQHQGMAEEGSKMRNRWFIGMVFVGALSIFGTAGRAEAQQPQSPQIDSVVFGGETLSISGAGFGTLPPEVTIVGLSLTVLMHSAELIVLESPDIELAPGAYTLRVQRVGGNPMNSVAEITIGIGGGGGEEIWQLIDAPPGGTSVIHLSFGVVGIRTTTPQYTLDVNGSVGVAQGLTVSQDVRVGGNVFVGPQQLALATGVEALRIIKGTAGRRTNGDFTRGLGFTAVYHPPGTGGTLVGTVNATSQDGRTIFETNNFTAEVASPLAIEGELYKVLAIVNVGTAQQPIRGMTLNRNYTGKTDSTSAIKKNVSVWPEFAITFDQPFSTAPVVTTSTLWPNKGSAPIVTQIAFGIPGTEHAGFTAFVASGADPFADGFTTGITAEFDFIAVGTR